MRSRLLLPQFDFCSPVFSVVLLARSYSFGLSSLLSVSLFVVALFSLFLYCAVALLRCFPVSPFLGSFFFSTKNKSFFLFFQWFSFFSPLGVRTETGKRGNGETGKQRNGETEKQSNRDAQKKKAVPPKKRRPTRKDRSIRYVKGAIFCLLVFLLKWGKIFQKKILSANKRKRS